MSIPNIKKLKIVICGLLLVSILSIACAGAGAGTGTGRNTATPAEIEVMEAKVAASSGAASGMYSGDYYPEYPEYPEFEKISVDPAYQVP